MIRVLLAAGVITSTLFCQPPTGPVVSPRGVLNAFTQQPAPSTVAPGGLIWINGLNLGPVDGLKAPLPWPTKLGDPAIEVLINGRNAPIGYISPGRIIVQVPYETAQGTAQLVVRRDGAASRPVRLTVNPPAAPSIRTANDLGYGDPAGGGASPLTLAVSGLGVTEPKTADGEAAGPDAPVAPQADIRAFVGGMPANVTATLSTDRVGEFDVKIDVPATANPGDIISVIAGNRSSNLVTYQGTATPELRYLALPDGTPEIRSIASTDLRGSLIAATGARDDSGCYPAYVFDVAGKSSYLLDPCLTVGNRNAVSPIVVANEDSAFAAFVGPPQGDAPAPVSSTVKLVNAVKSDPITVQLPASAITLQGANGGAFAAILGGTPPKLVMIDAATGEVKDAPAGQVGLGGGGGGGNLNLINVAVDLGDGLKYPLSVPVQVGGNQFSIVVGDNEDQPAKAKIANVNAQGVVQSTRDFPAGWVPLVAPKAAVNPMAPGGGLNGPLAGLAARLRVDAYYDATSRNLHVLARKADDSRHGFLSFAADNSEGKAAEFPDGWFAAACTPNITLFTLELSRRIAVLGDRTAEKETKTPCPATGFLTLDLAANTTAAIPIQGQGQMNAAGMAQDLNDYIYAPNTDPSRRGASDTLHVLDGVTGSAFRFDPPSSVVSFGPITPIRDMSLLVATANKTGQGDVGFLIFDMDKAETRLLPTPDGFNTVQLVGVFQTTRKLVARGNKPGGSQYLIYDLVTGDLAMPANPDGVAFVGAPPAQGPGQGGGGAAQIQVQRANLKANTVEAIGYGPDRKQLGVIVLRVN